MIKLELQRLINERNITQTKLEEMSGVRQARISQICRGYVDRLDIKHINAICTALNCKPWDWIIWVDE